VGEHGVGGHDLAGEREHAEELERGLVLVGLGVHPELAQDGRHAGGVGGQQVDAGQASGGAAAQRLAVQADDIVVEAAGGEPAGQGGLHPRRVEAAEQLAEGGLVRGAGAAEAEREGEGCPAVAAELGDGLQAGHAREQRDDGQAEDGGQRVDESAGVAGVGHVGQGFDQAERGHRAPPPAGYPASPNRAKLSPETALPLATSCLTC